MNRDEMPFDLFRANIPADVIDLMPASVAWENRAIPIRDEGEQLRIAVTDIDDPELADKLRFILNREVAIAWATSQAVEFALERYYPRHGSTDRFITD